MDLLEVQIKLVMTSFAGKSTLHVHHLSYGQIMCFKHATKVRTLEPILELNPTLCTIIIFFGASNV